MVANGVLIYNDLKGREVLIRAINVCNDYIIMKEKVEFTKKFAAVVWRDIREAGAEKWTAVISFYDEALAKIPGYKGLIYAKPPGRVVEAKKLNCLLVLPRYTLATEKAISLAHKLGMYVVAWTVNDPTVALNLWKRGVDGIATDDLEAVKPTKPP